MDRIGGGATAGPDRGSRRHRHSGSRRSSAALAENAKKIAAKAQAAAAANKDKLEEGIRKAAQTLDAKTGGEYHDQINKLDQQAEHHVEHLPERSAATPPSEPAKSEPAKSASHG